MGQKLFTDKIGTLSHSAGNILMAASVSSPVYLTIGGQQFKITSQLSVALPAMSANARYQVFAVQTAGVVSLVISLNENSVGPVGYSRWKLVGSLRANGSLVFGGFSNIKGSSSDWILSGTFQIGATTTAPTYGTATIDVNQLWYKIEGNSARIRWAWVKSVTGTATAGTGMYLFPMPANISIDVTKLVPDTTVIGANAANPRSNNVGSYNASTTGAAFTGGVTVYDSANVLLSGSDTVVNNASLGTISAGFGAITGAAQMGYGVDALVPILGSSNTPIEDR